MQVGRTQDGQHRMGGMGWADVNGGHGLIGWVQDGRCRVGAWVGRLRKGLQGGAWTVTMGAILNGTQFEQSEDRWMSYFQEWDHTRPHPTPTQLIRTKFQDTVASVKKIEELLRRKTTCGTRATPHPRTKLQRCSIKHTLHPPPVLELTSLEWKRSGGGRANGIV